MAMTPIGRLMPDGIGSQGATFQSGQLRSKREKRNRHQAKKKRATTLRHVVALVIVKLPRGTLTNFLMCIEKKAGSQDN